MRIVNSDDFFGVLLRWFLKLQEIYAAVFKLSKVVVANYGLPDGTTLASWWRVTVACSPSMRRSSVRREKWGQSKISS
jgi:hypothetical protein